MHGCCNHNCGLVSEDVWFTSNDNWRRICMAGSHVTKELALNCSSSNIRGQSVDYYGGYSTIYSLDCSQMESMAPLNRLTWSNPVGISQVIGFQSGLAESGWLGLQNKESENCQLASHACHTLIGFQWIVLRPSFQLKRSQSRSDMGATDDFEETERRFWPVLRLIDRRPTKKNTNPARIASGCDRIGSALNRNELLSVWDANARWHSRHTMHAFLRPFITSQKWPGLHLRVGRSDCISVAVTETSTEAGQ